MKERLRALDPGLLIPMLLLVFMGTLTVYSAGRGMPGQTDMWFKQTIWNLFGFGMMAFVAGVNPQRLFRQSAVFYAIGIVLLLAVLVVGKKLGAGAGARRWLGLGKFTFQPSELMKWFTLLFVAHRLASKPADQIGTVDILGAAALVICPMLLIFRQPDLGMALSFVPILALVPLIRGLNWKWVVIGIVAMSLFGVVAWKKILKPYQKSRVVNFLNPDQDLQGKNYQVNQSRIAIGAGGLLGQGFTAGSQTQLNYLPVKTTDFVFASWAEERGFVGVLLVLGLFAAVLHRILDIARRARTQAEMYFCAGTAAILLMHIFVNPGMVVGILPNKGIVLPFFSAGGSSTVAYFLGLGLVMGVQYRLKAR